MVFWVVTGVILVTLVVVLFTDGGEDAAPKLGIATMVWGLVVIILTFAQAMSSHSYERVVKKYDLTALTNNTEQEGAYFFLGTGVSEDTPVYQYIQRDADGGNQLKSVSINRSTVYEVTTQPRMEVITAYGDSWWMPWPVPRASGSTYKFYIPEGSITQTFNVSVK